MSQKKRLFIALLVPKGVATSISKWQRLYAPQGTKLIRAPNFHITLAFLGLQDETLQAQVEERLGHIRNPGWQQTLDRFGAFRKPQIGYLAPSEPKPELLNLAAQIQRQMAQLGIALPEQEYRPHVTVYRKFHLRHITQESLPGWQWPATSFALYCSDNGHYIELNRWSLMPST